MVSFVLSFDFLTDTGWVRVIADDVSYFYFSQFEFAYSRLSNRETVFYPADKVKNLKIVQ